MITAEEAQNISFDDLDLTDLARLFVDLRSSLEGRKKESSAIQVIFDDLRKRVLPEKMEEVGIENANLTGIGRVSLRGELYASIVADKKEEAQEWLIANGHGGMVKPTVNASTLKAFCKEQIIHGEELPETLFNVTPYTMATITKG